MDTVFDRPTVMLSLDSLQLELLYGLFYSAYRQTKCEADKQNFNALYNAMSPELQKSVDEQMLEFIADPGAAVDYAIDAMRIGRENIENIDDDLTTDEP